MFVIWLVPFIIGIILGIQLPFWALCIIAVVAIAYMGSDYVHKKEIAAIIDIIASMCLIIGMFLGKGYVYIAYPELRPDIPVINPFVPHGAHKLIPGTENDSPKAKVKDQG